MILSAASPSYFYVLANNFPMILTYTGQTTGPHLYLLLPPHPASFPAMGGGQGAGRAVGWAGGAVGWACSVPRPTPQGQGGDPDLLALPCGLQPHLHRQGVAGPRLQVQGGALQGHVEVGSGRAVGHEVCPVSRDVVAGRRGAAPCGHPTASHTLELLICWSFSDTGASHMLELLVHWSFSYTGASRTLELLVNRSFSYIEASHLMLTVSVFTQIALPQNHLMTECAREDQVGLA